MKSYIYIIPCVYVMSNYCFFLCLNMQHNMCIFLYSFAYLRSDDKLKIYIFIFIFIVCVVGRGVLRGWDEGRDDHESDLRFKLYSFLVKFWARLIQNFAFFVLKSGPC